MSTSGQNIDENNEEYEKYLKKYIEENKDEKYDNVLKFTYYEFCKK